VVVARVVGPAGSVTALDRSAPMIEALTRRMRQAGLANFSALVTGIEDADLPPGTFDVAIGRYVLMLLAEPASPMRRACTGLVTQRSSRGCSPMPASAM
jgi:ubiquinone/menaquinone biosynthesis C-methylase UbiE